MMSAYNYRGKVPEIEGLRGVAIMLVTVHHFWPEHGGIYERLAHVAHFGWIGVDLFFVISGFLIGGILVDTKNSPGYYKNFYARRILRIFPLYFAFVISLFLVIPIAQSIIHGVSYWDAEFIKESGNPFWYIFFAGNIRESITGVEPAYFLAPLWSLSIEEQFYLLSPLLINKLNIKQLKYVLITFIFLSPVFRYIMFWIYPDNERIQYLATISRLDNLSVGILLALLVRSKGYISPKIISGVLISMTVILAAIFINDGFNRNDYFCRVFGYSFLAAYFSVLVLWAVQFRDTIYTKPLRNHSLCFVGSICFGLYVLQRPAEVLLVKILGVVGFQLNGYALLSIIAKTLFAVVISYVVWILFEKPINNLKHKFDSKDHPMNKDEISKLQQE